MQNYTDAFYFGKFKSYNFDIIKLSTVSTFTPFKFVVLLSSR